MAEEPQQLHFFRRYGKFREEIGRQYPSGTGRCLTGCRRGKRLIGEATVTAGWSSRDTHFPTLIARQIP